MKPEHWSTISEIAAHLQVAEDSVLRWIQRKAFPAHRAGRVWRFKISEVDGGLVGHGRRDYREFSQH